MFKQLSVDCITVMGQILGVGVKKTGKDYPTAYSTQA